MVTLLLHTTPSIHALDMYIVCKYRLFAPLCFQLQKVYAPSNYFNAHYVHVVPHVYVPMYPYVLVYTCSV